MVDRMVRLMGRGAASGILELLEQIEAYLVGISGKVFSDS